MNIYNSFAEVYDIFMDNIPYDSWVEFIESIWQKYELKLDLVCELGCGTGNITQRLANKNYEMIGIDLSEDMLMVARDKNYDNETDIVYLMQDMRKFELFGTVSCILAICDSLNYIKTEQELLQVFKLVDNYLDPNGLFIFDLNTKNKFKEIYGKNTFTDINENGAYIWENNYNDKTSINEYNVTFFLKDDEKEVYHKYEEFHEERAYDIDVIKKLLEEAGLKVEGIFGENFKEYSDDLDRVYIVAREQKKQVRIDNGEDITKS